MYRHANGCVVIDENDIGKTKIELLTDLLYESTRRRIPEEHIKYGDPQALDQRPDRKWDSNTFIPFKIDADYDDRFSRNNTGFMYRRRDLSDYLADYSFTIEVDHFPFRISEYLGEINSFLPFPLDAAEILDYEFNDRTKTTFDLIADPKSLIWTGRAKITLEPLNPVFFKLVPMPFIPGFFQYQNPV